MTKPQALPVPRPVRGLVLGDRRLARRPCGRRRSALAVIVVLWLPFIAGRRTRQLPAEPRRVPGRASSPSCPCGRGTCGGWSRRRSAAGEFVADDVAFLGPLTLRHVGYVLTGLLSLLVAFVAILRDPRPRTLILGLAASTLVAFCFLTTMHERYAYGALVFLMLLIPEAPACAGSGSRSGSSSR